MSKTQPGAIHLRLLEKYLISAQEQASRLRAAIAWGDPTAAGQIAHGLKSNARAVGAMRLGTLCEKLEQAGKAGDLSALGLGWLRLTLHSTPRTKPSRRFYPISEAV